MDSKLPTWASKPGLFYAETTNIAPRSDTPRMTIGAATATDTATTTTTTVTTTTTTTSTSNRQVPASSATMPAMSLPTDRTTWANALLHHQKTGVPAMHQTIIDHDYEMALILLAAGADISACILPPLSEKEAIDTDKRPAFTIVHASEKKSVLNDDPNDEGERYGSFKVVPAYELSTANIVDFVLYAKSKAPQENLHHAGANALTLSLLSGAPLDFVRTLCESAASQQPSLLNSCDKLGRTPLGIAAAQGELPLVKLLLECKANPEVEDAQGLKPLDHALRNGHPEVTQWLVRQGIADPKNTKWKIAGFAAKHRHEGPVSLLTTLFRQHDMATILDYQQQSVRHRVAVFKVMMSLCKQAVDSGMPKALEELLDFAKPLLSTQRLAKIAIAVARRAGKLPELLSVLTRIGDAGFPKMKLAALRDAAGKSRDPAMLELAISLDHALTTLIGSTTRPSKKQLAQLNRLFALAMQVRDEPLILKVQDLGAKVALADPALAGLPMIGILADLRSPKLLRSALLTAKKDAGLEMHQQVLDAIDDIQTGEGLVTLKEALKDDLNGYELHQLLCRAVFIRDEWAVDELVKAGANVNYIATLSMGIALLNAGEGTPVSTAIATGNLAMLKKLIALGATLRTDDVDKAFRVSREFGLAVEALT